MYGIEATIRRLKEAERYQRRQFATAQGPDLTAKLDRLDFTKDLIRAAEESVKPGSAGFGMTGEATKSASRGGPFNQI